MINFLKSKLNIEMLKDFGVASLILTAVLLVSAALLATFVKLALSFFTLNTVWYFLMLIVFCGLDLLLIVYLLVALLRLTSHFEE